MKAGVITKNTSTSGGGVAINGGSFNLQGGEISGNTATFDMGCGVTLIAGEFTMSGGVIKGHTSGAGAGVHIQGDSTLTFAKTGGVIYGADGTANANTATDGDVPAWGHGVLIMAHIPPYGFKARNDTAGAGDNLYVKFVGSFADGTWTWSDPSVPGASEASWVSINDLYGETG